ncbi:MAG: hypothetical protein FJX72_10770, partial [Armatimonadetes bacterium]|nr:hypothetical protein [Armatimonadota bacterium]
MVTPGAGEGRENAQDAARAGLPPIPRVLFGVNQYNVGRPEQLARHWPLNDDDAAYLKSLGCNAIRFPLYPSEVGLDERRLMDWQPDGGFDPSVLGAPDWRSLDAVMEWMIRHQFTPNVCPAPEVRGDWSTKSWMSLHVPENAERTVWFTRLVVDYLTGKYGDRIVYGWYENWWWNTYKHEKSVRFPAAFRAKLSAMYRGEIEALNREWGAAYGSFDEVEAPRLMKDGAVDPAAVNSRRTFDLRRAMDLMQRDVLSELRARIKQKAPGALWAGGCLLNQLGALADIRSATVPSCGPSMRTAAVTGDLLSADLYSDSLEYYPQYRTLSKFAASAGTRLWIVEAPGVKPRAFGLIADVGGPSAGAMVWCGKEDLWGLIKASGERREANGQAWRELGERYRSEADRFARYRPGTVRVYFPEETLHYTVSARNHIDAYLRIGDHMRPEELEPVLTDELGKLPADARLFVLERTIPLRAIEKLEAMGDRVMTPHASFLDENGREHPRRRPSRDFFADLAARPEAAKLMDVFRRVEEKTDCVSFGFEGAQVASRSELAPRNDVLSDRPNRLSNLIDGSYNDGVTFADVSQDETVTVTLRAPRLVRGVFVDYFEGDGQQIPASRIPETVTVSVSADGVAFRQVGALPGAGVTSRSRIRFDPVQATG